MKSLQTTMFVLLRSWHVAIAAILILSVPASSFGQEGSDHHPWPKDHKVDMEAKASTATSSAATSDHALTWYVGGKGYTRKSVLELTSYDRKTGAVVAQKEVEWPFKITREPIIEQGVEWNDAMYLFSFAYDRNKRSMEFFYQAYDLKDLSEVVPQTLMAEIPSTNIHGHMSGAGLQFGRSPDGNKLSVYYPNAHDKEGQKQLHCWVFDKQNGLQWYGAHVLPKDKQQFISYAHMVDDNGVLHVIAKTMEGEKKDIRSSFSLYHINGKELESKQIVPPSGLVVSTATFDDTSEGIMVVGLLAGEKEGSTPSQFFISRYQLGDAAPKATDVSPLPVPPTASVHTLQSVRSPDGTLFLSGSDRGDPLGDWGRLIEEVVRIKTTHLFACAIDAKGTVKWSASIPRAMLHGDIRNPDHLLFSIDGRLVVMFTANERNLSALQAGKAMSNQSLPWDDMAMATFSDTSTPEYKRAGPPGVGMSYGKMEILPDGRTIYCYDATDHDNKKKNGFAFWHLGDR